MSLRRLILVIDIGFVFIFSLIVLTALSFFGTQGYHMAVTLEERCTREVSDHDAVIEALKAENEHLEGEKGGLADSLAALRIVLAEKDGGGGAEGWSCQSPRCGGLICRVSSQGRLGI